MANKSYSDKLKSPKWQKKRLEILNLRGFKCEICSNDENELHVHHRFYLKNREPWQYDNDVFQVLCSKCHEEIHKNKSEVIEVIPKKYEELILSIEKIENFDLSNIVFLIQHLEKDEINDIMATLANSLNSGWFEYGLNVLRDKEKIEELNIAIFSLRHELQRKSIIS